MSKTSKKEIEAIQVPLPEKEERRQLQVEVGMPLFTAVDGHRKKDGLTFRDIVEYGMAVYLAKKDPKAAEALGLIKHS